MPERNYTNSDACRAISAGWHKPAAKERRSSTSTLIVALRILARDIQSGDGVANAAIAEAADRLEEHYNLFVCADKLPIDKIIDLLIEMADEEETAIVRKVEDLYHRIKGGEK